MTAIDKILFHEYVCTNLSHLLFVARLPNAYNYVLHSLRVCIRNQFCRSYFACENSLGWKTFSPSLLLLKVRHLRRLDAKTYYGCISNSLLQFCRLFEFEFCILSISAERPSTKCTSSACTAAFPRPSLEQYICNEMNEWMITIFTKH